MFQAFGSLKGLLKVNKVCIDNKIFELHCKVTVIILMVFALIVTSKQYFGDPIECMPSNDDFKQAFIDTHCWTNATFTVVKKNEGKVGVDLVATGVGDYVPAEGDTLKFHAYYQWVGFVLFFQAVCFYTPRYVWKAWEGGRMKELVLHLHSPVVTEENKKERKRLLTEYFVSHLHNQNLYAVRFFICEAANFVNVVFQFYLTNRFLKGDFYNYGPAALGCIETVPDGKNNIMDVVFPKMTKCLLFTFGPGASLQSKEFLCILPLNVVNEKVYLVLWYVFVILIILSGLALVFRAAVIMSQRVRMYILQARTRLSSHDHIKTLTKKCSFGDWFILDQLARNIDSIIYREILAGLANKLKQDQNVRLLNRGNGVR